MILSPKDHTYIRLQLDGMFSDAIYIEAHAQEAGDGFLLAHAESLKAQLHRVRRALLVDVPESPSTP